MRKQYYFRKSPRGLLAWDVDRLVALTSEFARRQVPLSSIRELGESVFGADEPPTWRALVAHVQLIDASVWTHAADQTISGHVYHTFTVPAAQLLIDSHVTTNLV